MLAFSEEELLRMGWRELCQVDDQAALLPELRRLLAGELPSVQAALRVRHREGHWTWVRATLSPVRSNDGKVRHVIGELEDITEQRTADNERRDRLERQQRHQAAIIRIATHEAVANGPLDAALQAITEIAAKATNTARAGVWFLEEDGEVLRCAELYDVRSGRHETGAELAAAAYPAYFRALESDRVVDAGNARTDPRTRGFLDDYLAPLGITSMLDAPIRIRGRVVGVVCLEHVGEPRAWHPSEVTFAGEVADHVSQAVSNAQRTITESRLQMSEERFRSIIGAIPMGVLIPTHQRPTSSSGANPAADRILGVNCQRYLGKTIEEAFPPLAQTEIPDRYRAAAADGTPWHTQQIIYQDALIRGAYEVDAFQTAPGTVVSCFDITRRSGGGGAAPERGALPFPVRAQPGRSLPIHTGREDHRLQRRLREDLRILQRGRGNGALRYRVLLGSRRPRAPDRGDQSPGRASQPRAVHAEDRRHDPVGARQRAPRSRPGRPSHRLRRHHDRHRRAQERPTAAAAGALQAVRCDPGGTISG
jgi:PAS domain S-box-containing protein